MQTEHPQHIAPHAADTIEAQPVTASLSRGQRAMWFLWSLNPSGAEYGLPMAWTIHHAIDVNAFRVALQDLIDRHPVLRTTYAAPQGEPIQLIHAHGRPDFLHEDASQWTPAELHARLTREADAGFDLKNGAVFRARLFSRRPDEHVLFLNSHHIASDTWSLIVMMEELGLLYQARVAGKATELPPTGLGYVDYVEWQRNMLDSSLGDKHWAYWQAELGQLPVLDLPTDRPRPRVQTHVGAGHSFELDEALTQQIRALARDQDVTFYTVLLAVFYVLLYRYTGQDDIVVGSPRFGRPPQGYERTVGYFASPCALRAQLEGDGTFVDFLKHVRTVLVGAKEHQDFPFPLLVERLGVTRDTSRSPTFQVSFTYQKSHLAHMRGVASARMGLGGASLDLAGLPLESYPLEQHGVKFDLDFVVEEVDGRLRAVCWYNTALWDAESIGYLVDHYQALIASAVHTPLEKLQHLSMLTAQERTRYAVCNATEMPFLQTPVHRLFEGLAERMPQAVALLHEAGAVSYAELNARANQLAHYLHYQGLKPGQPVGVSMERSPELVVGILAVLKAGGAYLPLDPAYPAERLAYMQDDAGLTLLLTHRRSGTQTPGANVRMVCVDAHAEDIATESAHNLDSPSKPTDLAYVIYTSGSTGRPKGVMLEHYGLSNMVQAQISAFEIGPDSRVLQFASPSFDASVSEIFTALCAGAALCLAPKAEVMPGSALINTIARHAVTVITLPPSVLALLQPEDVPTLRTVAAAGEACSLEIVKRWAHGRRFLNAYGPTEATVCATMAHLPADTKRVSLGRPIANTKIYLLDAHLQQVPVGIAGEIHIAGVGLARGYLNRPDLTAERFVANPFEGSDSRMYKTGDLARYLHGTLEYLGRLDHQVKIRGFRIELGEVEAVITGCAGVREALVIARGTAGNAPSLLAYAIAHDAGDGATTANAIRTHAQGKLPEFMVPSAIMLLDAWPLTPNGKIDRAALPDPTERVATQNLLAPRDALEQQIARVWKAVLQLQAVGIDDNFFEVGGHSLDLVRVEIELEKVLGRSVATMDLFRFPNIRTLADYLRDASQEQSASVSRTHAVQPARDASLASAVQTEDTDVAIIGMAGRFPGAANVADFWRNLIAGVESVKDLSDEELLAAGVDPTLLSDPRYVKRKGVLDDVDTFDAAFFGYPPREALLMDPQQRLFLETGWHALEHAGYANPDYAGTIGVFGGTGRSGYLLHYLDANPQSAAELFQTTILNEKDFLSTRLAYKLNLRGPALTVQTACSTSLVAVHLACQQLILGECDMALAGGVSIEVPHGSGYLHQEGHILAPDGRCRPFDDRAQGTVRGSGGAIVVLKRLSAALADGDHVWAVIKGSAINNDGNAKVGFTAPGTDGQADVIERALRRAKMDPASIGFVEAHGTATPLGDPIEVGALTQTWRRYTDARQFCVLGSVKSNVGHLDAAAGVTGLIKAALSLHHGKIPATLHFQSPNPKLDLASSPFWVNDTPSDWPATASPRRAAVSSFGIGGTNAHVILEEAPRHDAGQRDQSSFQILALSAKSEPALNAMTDNLVRHLQSHPDANLADVAYTLQAGRTPFRHRRVVVCDSVSGAVDALASLPSGRSSTGVSAAEAHVTFIFPGQGLQQVDMGRDLYDSEAVFRDCVDRCAQLLQPLMHLDIRTVLYPPPDEAHDAQQRLMQTSITQPALFVVEYALAQQLAHWGIRPGAMMGHSLGEYVAACLADVISLADALRLVAARGQPVQQLPGGAMLAVEASVEEVGTFVSNGVDLAVVNAPRSCVLAGTTSQIEAVQVRLETAGLRSRRVATSHAFHSAMLEPILEQFRTIVSEVELRVPRIPYVTNVTGSWITHEQATDPAHWVRHMRETVRFAEGLETLLQAADPMFLEVGPGQTFTSIIRRHPNGAHVRVAAPTLSSAPGWSDRGALAMGLGRLWVAGAAPAWEKLHDGARRRRAALPGYPFEKRRFWPQRRTNAPARETFFEVADQAPENPMPLDDTRDRRPSAMGQRNDVESKLIKVFEEVLGVSSIASNDNFFELGGSSLSALSVILQVEQIFGHQLSAAALLESPTVEALAASLRTVRTPRSHQLVGMRTSGSSTPIFCIHPYGGHTTNYAELTRSLSADQPVYGIQAGGLQGESVPLRRIEAMASDYIDLMKSVQPHGPYRLVGHSMGGCIAYEMAQQLTHRDEHVELLALLDARAQNASVQPLYRNGTYGKIANRHWLSDDAVMLGILMPALSFDWECLREVAVDAHALRVLEAAMKQGLLPPGTGDRQVRTLLSVTDANDEALRRYRPVPYAGRVLLCCGDDGFSRQFAEPDLGWGALASDLEVIHVPGDHHSIMGKENVVAIVRHLERCLRENCSVPATMQE